VKNPLRWPAVWAVLLGIASGQDAAPALDFIVIPSVQYAHTEIFSHTPPDRAPDLALTDEIAPGQRLDLLLLVRGFAVDAGGRADLNYDLAIRYPDGKTDTAPKNIAVTGKTRVDPRSLILSNGIVMFKTDPGDPAGDYTFSVTLHDHVSGANAAKAVTVRVSDSAAALPLPANFDPPSLLSDYYRRPRPRLALPVLLALAHTPFADRPIDGQGALLGFFEQVLNDNPWVVPQFTARLAATADAAERRLLALVLAYTFRSQSEFGRALTGAPRQALEVARHEHWPRASTEPVTGGQLDVLWGRFVASGAFAPVRDLVKVVETYLPYRGKLEDYKKRATKSPVPPPEVTKDILLGSALWSLGSNARQHELVRSYLLGLVQSGDLSPATKTALQGALNWQPSVPPPLTP